MIRYALLNLVLFSLVTLPLSAQDLELYQQLSEADFIYFDDGTYSTEEFKLNTLFGRFKVKNLEKEEITKPIRYLQIDGDFFGLSDYI